MCQPDLEIDYGNPARSYPQVESLPVFSPQSSNCSSNGDNVPTQSHDEYLGTQAEAWILDGNVSNYDYDDNHSQPYLGGENTHCCDSGYHSDSASLKGCSDQDSSENHDQDSWLTLDNSQCHPPVSQENPPTEACHPEKMAEEQSLASQSTESQVVMAEELARLLQEPQSVQNALADECDYVALVSKAYEKAFQLLLASTKRLHDSIRWLQAVIGQSCSPTQSPSDGSLAQAIDVHGSHNILTCSQVHMWMEFQNVRILPSQMVSDKD